MTEEIWAPGGREPAPPPPPHYAVPAALGFMLMLAHLMIRSTLGATCGNRCPNTSATSSSLSPVAWRGWGGGGE